MNIKKIIFLNFCFLLSNLQLFSMGNQQLIGNQKEKFFNFNHFQVSTMEWGNRSNLLAIVATRGLSGIVQILDPVTGNFRNMDLGIKSMAWLKWNHDDTILLAIGDDFIRAWNILNGKLIYEISGKIASAELSNNGLFLAIALINGPIAILDVYTGRVYSQLNLRASSIKINSGDLIKFNPEATYIAIYSPDEKNVSIFQIDPEKFVGSFLVDQVNEIHAWASLSSCESPDCFREGGILSYDKKFLATIYGSNPLIRQIIKITDLS
ncbi:MAG: hypothetical protein V1646_04760 [bacterium]